MAIEHSDIVSSETHEPKGAAAAQAGEVYVANGAGSGSWTDVAGAVKQGVYNYNDLATASTPIALTLAGTQYELTNDGLGPQTLLTYSLAGLDNVWDVATDRFVFTDGPVLALGDTVDIRFDIEVTTTSANTGVEIDMECGIGGFNYQIAVSPLENFKSAGTYKIARWLGVYMGDSNTLDNPCRVLAEADTTGATVKVLGWYIRVLHTGT